MRWKYAKLSSPARGLLLAIISAHAEGIDQLTAGEWKEEAGIGNGRDWAKALRQLADVGLAELTKRGHMYVITAFALNGSGKDETDRKKDRDMIDNLSIYRTTDAKAAKHDSSDQVVVDLEWVFGSNEPKYKSGTYEPNFTGGAHKSGSYEPNIRKSGSNEPKSNMVQMDQISESGSNDLKSGCIEVDRMDDSGDLARSSSPAQARRRAQIAVVQKVWSQFFPDQPALLADNAKFFLSQSDQSAEAVYDFLEWQKSLGKNNPLAYARAVLKNRGTEKAPAAPTSPAFVPGPVSSPEPDPVEQDRIVRAAREQRVKLWRKWHPDEPVPADL